MLDTKIKVVFSGITLNTERQLVEGKLVTTYDREEKGVAVVSEELKKIENTALLIKEEIKNFLNNYTGSKEDREKAKELRKKANDKSKELFDNPLITNELKEEITQASKNSQKSWQALEEATPCPPEITETPSKGGPSPYYKETDKFDCHKKGVENQTDVNAKAEAQINQKRAANEEEIFYQILQAMQNLGGNAFLKCKECESFQANSETNFENGTGKITIDKKQFYKCLFGEIKNGKVAPLKLKGLNKNLSTNYDKQALHNYFEQFSEKIKQNKSKQFLLVGTADAIIKCDNVELQFTADFCSYIENNQINDKDKGYIIQELEKCAESNLIALQRQLVSIKNQLRQDQNVEWEHNGKVYRLNANNEIEQVQNALSDKDIIAGKWTGKEEQKMRFFRNENGIIQLKAFGFRSDLPIFKGDKNEIKKVDLQEVSAHILKQTNHYFKDLKDIMQKAPPLDEDAFADGKKIAINQEATYIRVFSEGVGITKTLLKTGKVESNVYLDTPTQEAYIQASGLVTGSVEGTLISVTDITGTVVMIYDLATDENARKEAYEGLVKIKDEIKENPSELFSLLGEIILEEASGNTSEEWAETTQPNTDKGRKGHLLSKGSVRTTITAVASGKLIAKLPKMADEVVVKMKKAKAKKILNTAQELVDDIVLNRKEIRKVLESNAGKDYAKKYFEKVVKQGDFEEWYTNVFKKYDLGEPLNFEVHHIIPISVLEKNKELQELLLWAEKNGKKFDFNGLDNGIPLQKKSIKYDINGHANHPKYDIKMREQIEKITNSNLSDDKKLEAIQNIINRTKNKLEQDVLLGAKDVNQIINF